MSMYGMPMICGAGPRSLRMVAAVRNSVRIGHGLPFLPGYAR